MSLPSPIYLPVMVLVLWTLLMLAWLAITRLTAMSSAGIELKSAVGGRGVDLEGVLPDRVNWKSHNYSHLLEQPTLFYATAIVLGIVGAGEGINLILAWTYVIVRVAHSLVQALWNRVAVRFTLFGISTLALLVMAVNAARLVA